MRHWTIALVALSATGALAAPADQTDNTAPAPPATEARSMSSASAVTDPPAPVSVDAPVPLSAARAGSFTVRRERALTATRERRWKDALSQWRALEEERPNDPGVTAELGWALLETGETQDARRRFQRAVHLEPMHVRAQAGLVALAIRSHDKDGAVRIARETARARPESAEAFRVLGDAQKAAARRSEAEDAYRRAVALDPNDARNHAGLGSVLFIRNKADEAVKEFRMAVRLDPGRAEYQEGLGRAALQGGRYSEAALAFATAMDLARLPEPDWARLDAMSLLALDTLSRASSAVHQGAEARQDVFDANTKVLEVTDALSALPVIENADPSVDPAMAQRALAYGLIGQAAASDLAALRKDSTSDAADAFVFREQARRAIMTARAGTTAITNPPVTASAGPTAVNVTKQ